MVLAITVLGSEIAAHDATVVSIALPTIGRDFLTSLAARLWVMNGYTLTLAIPADRAADPDGLPSAVVKSRFVV
jgi:MFS family permease